MALEKHFLSNRLSDLSISRSKLIIGLFLCFFCALIFYSFLNLSREVFYFMSINEESKGWVLSKNQLFFYNLIFGYISAIFGQSIAFNYLLKNNKKVFQRRRFRNFDITSSQNFIVWNNLSWFARLATIYGIFYYESFYSFSLYPKYNYLFIMLIVVMFFSSLNTFVLIFKRQMIRILFFLALINSVLAFSFSQINLVDCFSISNDIKKSNIYYKYKFEKVSSDYYYKLVKLDLVTNLYIVSSKDTSIKDPILYCEREEFSLDRLSSCLEKIEQRHEDFGRGFITINLCIDKEVPLSFINSVKFKIAQFGFNRMAYSITPKDLEKFYQYSSNTVIRFRHPPLFIVDYGPPPPKFPIDKLKYNFKEHDVIVVFHEIENTFRINEDKIEINDLKNYIQNSLQKKGEKTFIFVANNELSFELFLNAYIIFRKAYKEVFDTYALEEFNRSMKSLSSDEYRSIRKKINAGFIEVYPELLIEFVERGDLNQKDFDFYYPDYPNYIHKKIIKSGF